jgi:hypothetical protein
MLDAIEVAKAIHDAGGVPRTRDQVATAMGASPGSGSFSLKIGAARVFGLVEVVDGKYQLTSISSKVLSLDESQAAEGRRDAFLAVPLYRRALVEFKGKPLPPRPLGIEEAFVAFGVPAKQKDKARWAFERSAEFAGFFSGGRDRLVEPLIRPPPSRAEEILDKIDKAERASPVGVALTHKPNDPTKEPLIHGLLIRLPEAGTEWSHEKRVQWLKLFASVLEMVYEAPANDLGLIDVDFKPL